MSSVINNTGHLHALLSESGQSEELNWLTKGLICKLKDASGEFVSVEQHLRLSRLVDAAVRSKVKIPNPTSLFPSSADLYLGAGTMISKGVENPPDVLGKENILCQLLPYWIKQTEASSTKDTNKWAQAILGSLEVSSGYSTLIDRIVLAQTRADSLNRSRAMQFARSASYMGSKTVLAPFLSEIMHTYFSKELVVLDLMCGSGAAAGVFSHNWKTIASDAQQFSRLLAIVQGGGMTVDRAQAIADRVLSLAREHFENLPEIIKNEILIESEFLATEITPDVLNKLFNWMRLYPRIGNSCAVSVTPLINAVLKGRTDNRALPYVLFSAYYGNLFFGVRQAAEIDSLRFAIDQLEDLSERSWALGSLVCAVSSCAYAYGGHFAQPKIDGSDKDRLEKLAQEMLATRGLSVSHEYFVRFTNLAGESAVTTYPIGIVDGPWEAAFPAAADAAGDAPVCVYLDPPYTRDEYSRYYHVLETLVRYDYPLVQGKPSIPKRGSAGRFASPFATRHTAQVELLLAKIINECQERKWSCLWSYSNTGAATISNVLAKVLTSSGKLDIFCMDHTYKAQGRQLGKAVKEYVLLIHPK